jgi:BASS family bile acid:Na+ symporter
MRAPMDEVRLALDQRAQGLLALLLAFVMWSVGLGLRPMDFRRVGERPRAVLVGLLLQVVALPALTFVAARTLAPSASLALGMIVVASCPGGSASSVLTLAARGDLALTVSVTALSSLLAGLTTPANILLWASLDPRTASLLRGLGFERGPFLLQTALTLALPLALGMWLAARRPDLAARLHGPCHKLALGTLGLFVIAVFVANRVQLVAHAGVIVPLVVGHNLLALGIGYAGARLAGLPRAQRRSLTFEVGIQNAGLGLVILLGQFQALGGAALVTASWGIWHLISGGALAAYWARRPPGQAPQPVRGEVALAGD